MIRSCCLCRSLTSRPNPFRSAPACIRRLPLQRSPHFEQKRFATKKATQSTETDRDHEFKYPGAKNMPLGETVAGTRKKPTLDSFSLEGKTAVVTGGARGLGLVMAQALMMSGADVAIVDLNEDGAKEAAARLTKTYQQDHTDQDDKAHVPKITAHACDVADPASIEQCMKSILSEHKQITTLLTSAGFTENFAAENYPADRLRKLMQVNVDGTYLWAAAVAKHIFTRRGTGEFIFVASMSGSIVNVPQPQAPYNASKAAVRHLAASLGVEWAQRGIRVNCISPGYMLTALTEKILEERPDYKEEWTGRIPMGRMGKPEELMGAVVFLASDASRYMTGAELTIDGGYTLI